jgi:hypothetical protein
MKQTRNAAGQSVGRPAPRRILLATIWAKMKLSISLSALLIAAGFVFASSEQASAVVYCQYISYPAACVVRPGVGLVARPVARAITPGRPMNRGGPVNRVGRR